MMQYKGYYGHAEYDAEARCFHGEVIGLKDVITFQGESVVELEAAFKGSINDYITFCKERGENPEKPYSGKFNLRLYPELHAQLVIAANKHKESLNSYIMQILEKATGF
jgi:predicted HicB family RNase H-like nuclease